MPQRGSSSYSEDALAPLLARTASGDSGVWGGYGPSSTLRVQLNVTAFTVAAGNTLDVVIEDTVDGTNWNPIATFAQRTGNGREMKDVVSSFSDRIRVRWTIAGAPAPTFSVIAVSQTVQVA